MQDMKEILKTLSCACGPSGKEDDMFDAVAAVCRGMNVEIKKTKWVLYQSLEKEQKGA